MKFTEAISIIKISLTLSKGFASAMRKQYLQCLSLLNTVFRKGTQVL